VKIGLKVEFFTLKHIGQNSRVFSVDSGGVVDSALELFLRLIHFFNDFNLFFGGFFCIRSQFHVRKTIS
jgi:hypothetical protein